MAHQELRPRAAQARHPAWYRVVMHSWRTGGGVLPTTRAGAEIAVIITLVGWRVGTLIQMAPAVPDSLEQSQRAWLDALLLVIVLIESAALLTWAVRRRGYLSLPWAVGDTALGIVCLLTEPLYVPTGDRVGTWIGWAPGLAVNITVCAAMASPKSRQSLAMAAALGASYFAVSVPEVNHGTALATVVSNTVTYLVFGVVARAMCGFVRRFGEDADSAREAAIEAKARLEAERNRRLLHDPASLLRYLADPALDPRLAETVRAQALAEANRIRAYLSEPQGSTGSTARDDKVLLVDAVRRASSDFTDLPIEIALDLASAVVLLPAPASAITAAAATVLHNVRHHAGSVGQVVIHADYQPAEAEWELTIRDDGIGFDAESVPRGYGLNQLVDAALAEHGISSHVLSQPGTGTTITIRGTYRDERNEDSRGNR